VICLGCRRTTGRQDLDRRLHGANPDFGGVATRINPDGDVELDDHAVTGFALVACVDATRVCSSGRRVLRRERASARVEQCYQLVDDSDALLVLGSSLTVMFRPRFVRHAARAGKPVLIINRGRTRGDKEATVRVDRPLGEALTELVSAV